MEASKLKEILEQHKLWVDGKGGKRALLEGANLGGADLEGADLRRADLEGAILCIANLQGANLRGAKLTGANLYGASLRGANLTDANLNRASLNDANLSYADLKDADLSVANLTGAIGLPNVSWVIPGCLVQLNHIKYGFYLKKESKWENFTQDSFGVFIQNNETEGTFDMLVEDRIIRNIPDWVKLSGLKQIASESD